jgi:hypothetical protein
MSKQEYDKYFTPDEVALKLAKRAVSFGGKGKKFLEPCAGTGQIIKALISLGVSSDNILAYDIAPDVDNINEVIINQQDFLSLNKDLSEYIAVTNPPFSGKMEINFLNHLYNKGCKNMFMLMPEIRRVKKLKDVNRYLDYEIKKTDKLGSFHFIKADGSPFDASKSPIKNCSIQHWSVRDCEKILPEMPVVYSSPFEGVTNYCISCCGRYVIWNFKNERWGNEAPEGSKSGGIRPLNSMDTLQFKLDRIDFTVTSHATRIGDIDIFQPDKDKPSVRFFVEVIHSKDVSDVVSLFRKTDWSNLRNNGKTTASVTPDEIIYEIENNS